MLKCFSICSATVEPRCHRFTLYEVRVNLLRKQIPLMGVQEVNGVHGSSVTCRPASRNFSEKLSALAREDLKIAILILEPGYLPIFAYSYVFEETALERRSNNVCFMCSRPLALEALNCGST